MESDHNNKLNLHRCYICKEHLPADKFYPCKYRSAKVSSSCKACTRAKQRAYYRNNTEKCKAANRANAKKNLPARRAKARQKRIDAINAYGGLCQCCNEETLEFLCIDHVNDDGGQHRLELGGYGRAIYKWLAKHNYPQDGRFQVLCHNCNMAKSLYGGCPHKGKPPGRIVRKGLGYINKYKKYGNNKIHPSKYSKHNKNK